MNKLEYKERMKRIKSENKRRGLKWNKEEMRKAQDMVIMMTPKKENWTPKPKIQSIKEILDGFNTH